MITDDCFLDLVDRHLGWNLRDPANGAQRDAVTHSSGAILQIVAGPGSGKTTVLVLRALRSVFVHDILPENILITTFTRKAAQELRTRWLDWGTVLLDALSGTTDVERIDINRSRIDTLDSTVRDVLTEFRPPGALAPALAETSASLLFLKREVFQPLYWQNKDTIDTLLSRYTFDRTPPPNQATALGATKRLLERLVQDRVDLAGYAQEGPAEQLMVEMLEAYRDRCIQANVFDFTLLEEQFLERLSGGQLADWIGQVRALLVDEYQDTNPLQEAIYYSLIGSSDLSATIVGDDDQSMYRFRGGSVELFTEFPDRCLQVLGRQTRRVDMVRNFRSLPEIVDFFNQHISDDQEFQRARIDPPKPLVSAVRTSESIPVLGMFREDESVLAADLADFISTIAHHQPVSVGDAGQQIRLSEHGALGDAVFLAHSVEEVHYYRGNETVRLPGLLRAEIEDRGLQVFNPRGQALRSIPDVQIFLGLMLLAIDPDDAVIDAVRPTNEARLFLNRWREEAESFVDSKPPPNDGRGLRGFIADWQGVASGKVVDDFPPDWPVLELVFKLVSWMPGFQTAPEHQVWLEAITRTVASAGMASPYGMQLLQNVARKVQSPHVGRSRLSFVRDALVPIAEDEVQVDEDIIPSIPRDRLQFMTIHQAKGLEFPLVIVDVGSRFKINSPSQRFLRFPDSTSNVVRAENDVEPHLPSPIRVHRGGRDRTFDDLVRLYYVAYSRPQSVLLLVGNEKGLRYRRQGEIPNVALGWHRNGTWPWRQPYTTRRPPVKVEPPFWEM